MVKQKVVIQLFMKDQRERTKALKAATGMDGITSTSIDGDKIVVEGDGIDSIVLTTVLRNKFKDAQLISVTSGDEKKKEEKTEDEPKIEPVMLPHYYAVPPPYPYHAYEVGPTSCNIM